MIMKKENDKYLMYYPHFTLETNDGNVQKYNYYAHHIRVLEDLLYIEYSAVGQKEEAEVSEKFSNDLTLK